MSDDPQMNETVVDLEQQVKERDERIQALEQSLKELQESFAHPSGNQSDTQAEPASSGQAQLQQLLKSQLNASQANERSWSEAFKATSAASLLNLPITPMQPTGDTMTASEFRKFKTRLEALLSVAGELATEQTKLIMLKLHGGKALTKILDFAEKSEMENLVEPIPVFSNAMLRLEKHFKGLNDEVTALHRFRSAAQRGDEKASDFILRLHELAKLCDMPEDQVKKEVVIQFRSRARDVEFRKLTNKTDAAGEKIKLNELYKEVSVMEEFNEQEKGNEQLGDATKRVFKISSDRDRDRHSGRYRSRSRDRDRREYRHRSRSPFKPFSPTAPPRSRLVPQPKSPRLTTKLEPSMLSMRKSALPEHELLRPL